jgi:tetratricopeptide (TPR) repeat protein
MSDHLADMKAGLEEYRRLLPLLDQRDRVEELQVRARVLLDRDDIGMAVRARLHNLLCWTYIEGLRRPSAESVLHGEEAVRIARRADDRELLLQALANLAHAYTQVSDHTPAAECYREILQQLQGQQDLLPFGRTVAHIGLGYLHYLRQRYDEALAEYGRAEADCRAQGSRYFIADLARRKALVLVKMGRAAEAGVLMESINESTFDLPGRSLWWKPVFMASMARVQYAQGNLPAAREVAQNTLVLARELGDQAIMAEACCILAQADYQEGRKEASRRARSALTYAIASGRRDVVEEVRERLSPLLGMEI